MRITRILAAAALAAAVGGCVDSPLSSGRAGDAQLVVASEFSFSGMAAGLPIDSIRLTPRFFPEGTPAGEPQMRNVDDDDESFEVVAEIDLGGRDSATVTVLLEMISTQSGEQIVEWSALIGPVLVEAGVPTDEHEPVTLIRGPIENQFVDSIAVFGPSHIHLGTTHPAHANVFPSGTAIWSSSDLSVVTVDPVGDSVDIHAVGAGTAWVRAGAGVHTDSFMVTVEDITAGPPEHIFVFPMDSTYMVVGSTRTFEALVTDSLFIPVTVPVTWESLDASIATVGATGIVSAVSVGRARIVASAAGLSDTVIVHVQTLPAGVDHVWVGGAPLAANDWFTPENWSPVGVPGPTDVVYIGSSSWALFLDANAEVGGIKSDTLGFASFFDIGNNTLTVHGHLEMFYLYGDSLGRVIMDGANATLYTFGMPSLTVRGNVALRSSTTIEGDLVVDGGTGTANLTIPPEFAAYVLEDFRVSNATLTMTFDSTDFDESFLYVEGDVTFDGGNSGNTMTGGQIVVGGDFTVTAASCNAFRPAEGAVELYSDTATISIGCSNPTGNRFMDLWVYSAGVERLIELLSDVHIARELYIDGGDSTHIDANGRTIRARIGSIYNTTIEDGFLEIVSTSADDYFYADSLVFRGMAGETRPQVLYQHPGFSTCAGCYEWEDIYFDPSSSGPYIRLEDTVANGDSIVLYMAHNPGNGPSRTITVGEAAVHWAGVAANLLYWSGSGQSGTQHQPLPDSLYVEVVDYAFQPVEGATVNWTVTAGNGTVSPPTSVTDSLGLAATRFTVGDTLVATQQVVATTPAVPSDTVVFYAYPTPVPPNAPHTVREATPRDAREAPDRRRPADRPELRERPAPTETRHNEVPRP